MRRFSWTISLGASAVAAPRRSFLAFGESGDSNTGCRKSPLAQSIITLGDIKHLNHPAAKEIAQTWRFRHRMHYANCVMLRTL